jgi:hypothetical protein
MEIPGVLPLILEDWESHLAGIPKGESGETAEFFLHLQVTDWPHEPEKFFVMSDQRRPYAGGSAIAPADSLRKLWALNGLGQARLGRGQLCILLAPGAAATRDVVEMDAKSQRILLLVLPRYG